MGFRESSFPSPPSPAKPFGLMADENKQVKKQMDP